MAYLLDEGWHGWPEIVRAGSAAAGLYSRCGSWIADNATDGLVPAELARMYGTAEWIQRLVDVGLWRIEGDGFRDLRYFPTNPTKAEIEKKRADAAARQRKRRHGKQPRESRVTNKVSPTVTSKARAPRPPTGGSGGARPLAHLPSCPYQNRDPATCSICASERKSPHLQEAS